MPVYVESGVADVGLVGSDQVLESRCDVLEPLTLDLGHCRLSLCAPGPKERELRALPGRALRVATKYPHLASTLLARKGLSIEVLKLQGSVELAPVVGLADAIVDLVETGRTLVENGHLGAGDAARGERAARGEPRRLAAEDAGRAAPHRGARCVRRQLVR